jgi:photosystem II stability/assembly factor-like uncharacterized protein
MRVVFLLSLLVVAASACDRVTTASRGDASPDSLATLWQEVDAGTGPTNFNAVSGSAAENVLVVGDQGTILHWDGTALLREESGTTANLRGVAVANDNLAYAVGDQGTILRRQDGVWTAEAPLTDAVLNAVWADSASACAVGEQGVVVASTAGVWSLIPNICTPNYHSCTDNYYAITNSNDGLEVIGGMGVVSTITISTKSISAVSIPGYMKLLAGATRSGAGAYFVGVEGGFISWSGGNATQVTGLPPVFLRGVAVVGGDVWVVGHEGFVAKLPGGQAPPITIPTPDNRWLISIYAASDSDVWIVGRSGAILRGPPGIRRDGGVP